MITQWQKLVMSFREKVLGQPRKLVPQALSKSDKASQIVFFDEEIQEFEDAESLEDQADACMDLIYFSLGALVKMGVHPGAVMGAVHKANMNKEPGVKPSRKDVGTKDAIKPKDWSAPDFNFALDTNILSLSPALIEAHKLRITKSQDYQSDGSNISLEEYFPFGDESYVHMINQKCLRVRSCVSSSSTKGPNFESLQDSLVDLINYSSFYYEYLEKNK
jgi:predicted HAD superfamily Cof-like phosphohydrolase